MTRKLISSGSRFEEAAGYSRAVVDGEWVFVSGCTGFDYKAGTISDDVVEQAEQTFRNIEAALKEGGATLADVVRTVIYICDRGDFEWITPVLKKHFGKIRPTSTAVIAQLVDARMKIEIEVTARKAPAAKS
jgi:enamine deaminase RidA (YjgF/YER057c/UK114 family)